MYYDKQTEVVAEPQVVKKPYPEPWRQDLLEAAQMIRKYGWIRNHFGHHSIGFCTLGAYRQVASIWDYDNVGARMGLKDGHGVADWNDNTAKSIHEVIDRLEAAAGY